MRIALLGGTFDPVHKGHLRAARTVVDAFDIDELHFIPAFAAPHKARTGTTSAFHRFAMVALAINGHEKFRLSTIEVDRLEPRFTVNTLEQMQERYPGGAFLFITGTDLYADIETWKDHRRLFELASFAVVNRPGFPMRDDIRPVEVVETRPEQPLSTVPRVYYLPHLHENTSSTELRESLRGGEDPGDAVPDAVRTYVAANGLYS